MILNNLNANDVNNYLIITYLNYKYQLKFVKFYCTRIVSTVRRLNSLKAYNSAANILTITWAPESYLFIIKKE